MVGPLASGETGLPLVDAGMRQLNTTGWMHNRLRMVTSQFLRNTCLLIGVKVSGTLYGIW